MSNYKSEISVIKQTILNALEKLNEVCTIKLAHEMIRNLISEQNSDQKINYILMVISENLLNPKGLDIKELIKLLPIISTALSSKKDKKYLSKLLTILQSVIQDENMKILNFISEAFGEIVEKTWDPNLEDQVKKNIFELMQGFCIYNIKHESKSNQICGCLCLSRLISGCPYILNTFYLKFVWETIISRIESENFHAKSDLLDSLVSLIFAAENDFQPFASTTIFKVLDFLMDNDWQKRKHSLDIIYTITNYCEDEVKPLKNHICDFIKDLKSDSVKLVREACLATLDSLSRLDAKEGEKIQKKEIVHKGEEKKYQPPSVRNSNKSEKIVNEISNISEIKNDGKGNNASVLDEIVFTNNKQKNEAKKTKSNSINKVRVQNKKPEKSQEFQKIKEPKINKKSSIFKGPKNREFFSHAGEGDIQIKVSDKAKSNEDEENYLKVTNFERFHHNIEENDTKNKSVSKDGNKHTYLNPTKNKEKEKQEVERNKDNERSKNEFTFSNSDLLKQIKILSEKQVILIDAIEGIQSTSSRQINELNNRINVLEDFIIKMKFEKQEQNHVEPFNINTEIDLKMKTENINDIINYVFSKKNEDGLLYLIEQINITKLRELDKNLLEECISRLNNILIKASSVDKILPFIKTAIINLGDFLRNSLESIIGVLEYLYENKSLFNIDINTLSEIENVISLISFKLNLKEKTSMIKTSEIPIQNTEI